MALTDSNWVSEESSDRPIADRPLSDGESEFRKDCIDRGTGGLGSVSPIRPMPDQKERNAYRDCGKPRDRLHPNETLSGQESNLDEFQRFN
jgi:hypothetical protein